MIALPFRLMPDPTRSSLTTPVKELRGAPLGQVLIALRALSPARLTQALALQGADGPRLGEILIHRGWVTPGALARALALQTGARSVGPDDGPVDPHLIDRLGAGRCLALCVLPWRRAGAVTIVATARPEDAEGYRQEVEAALGPVRFAIASETTVRSTILATRRNVLSRRAELRVPEAESCRSLGAPGVRIGLAVAGLAVLTSIALFPVVVLTILAAWASLMLILTSGLRIAAALAHLVHIRRRTQTFQSIRTGPAEDRLPIVSLIVPLYREAEMAGTLIQRLSRLDYPKERLDICIVTEDDDTGTETTLRADLPENMRILSAPRGTLRTKPRAMNFALDFCRGTIVGVYDAEDAPATNQIRRVVARFHEAGPDLACLQGVLDYYNARTNWLSRCFTIDYATWFRVILPGIERLGLPIPLGGTTVFFRRATLEAVGAWDAQNVTEDADLGIRLARHGYRTELLVTVTEEEANCRALPWIRQRSRWQKGYALTWATHSRRPLALCRDLGAWRFLGFQILFLGSLSQFLLAPLLWSFWGLAFGLPHPLEDTVPTALLIGFGITFLLAELLNIAVGTFAVSGPAKRWLIPWVPTLHFYYPLGTIAIYKAAVELVVRPFYWDKTRHGVYGRT